MIFSEGNEIVHCSVEEGGGGCRVGGVIQAAPNLKLIITSYFFIIHTQWCIDELCKLSGLSFAIFQSCHLT